MKVTYTPTQVLSAAREVTAELKALTDDPAVIQRWLAPRVRVRLTEMSAA